MIFKGVLAENYVAEILYSKYRELYYWQIGSGMYEVDFLINIDGDIIPIEIVVFLHSKVFILKEHSQRSSCTKNSFEISIISRNSYKKYKHKKIF